MEPASSYPKGVSTKIINHRTGPGVIKTHQRRCKAAVKRPAFLVEAPPNEDSPPSEWAFDGLARWHTWPLLPLKQVHDVQGNHHLVVHLPGR
jgi:hypothetical protein